MVKLKPGDVVFAKGVAKFGTTGSLEFTVPSKQMYCCLLLGQSHDREIPKPTEHARLGLLAGVVSLDDVRDVLGETAFATFMCNLNEKYQTRVPKI